MYITFNPLNADLNPICYLLSLLGAHHFLHVSRIRVNGTCCMAVSMAKETNYNLLQVLCTICSLLFAFCYECNRLCFHSDVIIEVPYKVPAREGKYFEDQELKIIFYFHVHCGSQLARSHDLIALSRVVGQSNASTSGENTLFLDMFVRSWHEDLLHLNRRAARQKLGGKYIILITETWLRA